MTFVLYLNRIAPTWTAGYRGTACGPPSAAARGLRFTAEPLGVVGAIEIKASPWIEGNLWGRSLVEMVKKPEFIAGVKEFAAADLTFDTANPRPDGNWVSFETTLAIVRQYFDAKGPAIAEKYFWKNSTAAYKWNKRLINQPELTKQR